MFILINHIIFLISMTLKISAIHRLDRLVSGLLILARSASKADFFRQQVKFMLPYPSNGKKSHVRILLLSKTDCFTHSTVISRPLPCSYYFIVRLLLLFATLPPPPPDVLKFPNVHPMAISSHLFCLSSLFWGWHCSYSRLKIMSLTRALKYVKVLK